MAIRATITVTIPVSDAGHAARDKVVAAIAAIDGAYLDVFRIKELTDELDRRAKDGEQQCLTIAKKAGLKPVGRLDLSCGLHGNKTGALEMWFQIRAES